MKPINLLKILCASLADSPDDVQRVHRRSNHRSQRSSAWCCTVAGFTFRAVAAMLGLLTLGVLTTTAQPQFGFVGSFNPLVEFDNNIRNFTGVLEQTTNITITVEQTDSWRYTVALSDGVNALALTNLLQTGNRIQNETRPMTLPDVNVLDFIMLSDGTNRAFVHVAQETFDPDDISFMVASWSSYTGSVAVADFLGTWDIEAYGDANLRSASGGFDYDRLTTSVAQVDADHIGLLLLNGATLVLRVLGNEAFLESPPVIAGSIRYHAFHIHTAGRKLSFSSVASEVDDLTDVAVTVGLGIKQAGDVTLSPLSITNLGDQILVSWPNSLTNYALEWTTNLAAGPWHTISSNIFWVGNRSHFTNPAVPASRFFRLKQVNTSTQVTIDVASYANLHGQWDYRRTEAETGEITPWALSVLGITNENGQPVYLLQEYDEAGFANDQEFWHTNLSEGAFQTGGLNDYGQPTQEKWYWQPFAPRLMRSFVPGAEYTNSYTRTDMPGVAIEGRIKTEADTVSVPYGILDCCKVTRTFAIEGQVVHVERAWFAINLGLVKRDQDGGDLWELISYQPVVPSSTNVGYYEVYGNTDAATGSMDPSDFTLIDNSVSGNTFDVSAYGRFMILVPSSSGRVLFDAFGLDSQWVDSAPGPERMHILSNMNPTDGTWAANGDSCIEGPPDGVTMESTAVGDSIYTFSTLAATQLTVYTIP